ncbi:MAG: hypothetical protein LBL66_06405 [Clostridiales bacterium]|nr:hypothetical protein [Clostridiales bacterium]
MTRKKHRPIKAKKTPTDFFFPVAVFFTAGNLGGTASKKKGENETTARKQNHDRVRKDTLRPGCAPQISV